MNFKLFRNTEFTFLHNRKLVFLKADRVLCSSFLEQNKMTVVTVPNYLANQKAPLDNFSVLQQNIA